MARRHIVVDDEIFEEIYHLKGPHRSMASVIRDLLNAVYPPEKENENQTTLELACPECDEILIDGVCPGCGYPDEE